MFKSQGHLSDDHFFVGLCSLGFQGWIALLHLEVLLSEVHGGMSGVKECINL